MFLLKLDVTSQLIRIRDFTVKKKLVYTFTLSASSNAARFSSFPDILSPALYDFIFLGGLMLLSLWLLVITWFQIFFFNVLQSKRAIWR